MNDQPVNRLERAIESVRDGTSLYWASYHSEEWLGGHDVVEVRLDASADMVSAFSAPSGWTLARVQWGDTIFMRRQQSLARADVETMLTEMLRLAAANGMRFHSWIHGADVD